MILGFLLGMVRLLKRQCRVPVALRSRAARDEDPEIDRRRKIGEVARRVSLHVSEYPRDWLEDILRESAYQLNLAPRPMPEGKLYGWDPATGLAEEVRPRVSA